MFAKKRSSQNDLLRRALAGGLAASFVLTLVTVSIGGNLGIRSNNVGGISVNVEGVVGPMVKGPEQVWVNLDRVEAAVHPLLQVLDLFLRAAVLPHGASVDRHLVADLATQQLNVNIVGFNGKS